MTNEEIIKEYGKPENWISLSDLLDLARADEREKMTEEKIKEYFAGLNGKETALIVLNYLLRGGITDDDLRGLRLQWIKEQPEENNFYCADWNRCGTTCEEQCATCGKTDNLEQPEGVVAWITASKHYAEIYIGGDEPNRMIWGHFYKSSKEQHCSRLNRHTARLLGVELNQCAKFKIVRVE